MNLYFELTRTWAQNPDRDIVHCSGQAWSFTALEKEVLNVAEFISVTLPQDSPGLISIEARSNWARLVAILACIHQTHLFATDSLPPHFSARKIALKLTDTTSRFSNDIPYFVIPSPERILRSGHAPAIRSQAYASDQAMLRLAATSGTTGAAKWVGISVGAQLRRIHESQERIDSMACEANMFLCGASAWFPRFFATAAQGTLISIDTNAQETLAFLREHKNASVYSSPDHLVYLLAAVSASLPTTPTVQSVTVCGGALTPSAALAVKSSLGAKPISQYASTECGHTAQTDFEMTPNGHSVVGQIASVAQVRVTNEMGALVAPMHEGTVWVKSSYMADGYIDLVHGNSEPFKDGWFDSGDIGYLTSDGRLVLAGRKSDVVNIRGAKVNLQHVDAFFADIPGVLDAAGFLMPGELDFPEVWVAVVLSQPIEATAIQTDCLKQLGFILAPSQMIQVRAIPRTLTGKVKRHEMTEKLKKLLATQPEQ